MNFAFECGWCGADWGEPVMSLVDAEVPGRRLRVLELRDGVHAARAAVDGGVSVTDRRLSPAVWGCARMMPAAITIPGGTTMHRTTTTAAAVLLLAVLTVGCSSGDGGGDGKPDPGKSSTAAGLAGEWGPKLAAATDGKDAVCNQVGDKACATHLTDIALVVGELEQAVNEAGGTAEYPRTVAEIGKVNAAVDAYTEHECLEDENAGIQGSPCPDDAQTILTGGQTIALALQADEGA
ncbi:hypothetical protein OIE75_40940 (plasmid) [Streptomyces sp. NBC_01723]|uniref:hypothetical protein n=1 Tax=Streptomyces sp. NBC_01723 TaxID=2975921 RepID=UPI002E35CF88|nr:hypothetical protein [Streptomyces sp. NBC_01723]